MNILVYKVINELTWVEVQEYSNENSLDAISRKLPPSLYTTFRTYDSATKVVGLDAHIDRLYIPLPELNIQPAVDRENLRSLLIIFLRNMNGMDARVRISLLLQDRPGEMYIFIEKMIPMDEKLFTYGVNVVSSHMKRENPRVKSTEFIMASADERKAILTNEVYEALIVKGGTVLEGATSNFFVVRDGKIITARKKILLGVTRRVVLRLCRKAKYEIIYKPFRIDELSAISEAFITSSSRGIVPIVMIDSKRVGEGSPGPIFLQLRKLYKEYFEKKAQLI